MAENKIGIVITAEDNASSEINRFKSNISSMKESVSGASESMKSSFGSFSGFVGKITSIFAAIEGTKAFFGLTSQVEQSKIAFESLLGSQEKAKQMLADIDEFAAKTPFEKVSLTPLVQQLIGMGFEAQKALPTLQVLGDSMAALGRGQDDLNGVVLALGQIQTKGKLSAEELMQLAERGLPVFQILEQQLGLTKKQLGDIGNAGISSATGINALLTGLNERFGGMMAKQALTLAGQWSNMLDNMKSLLGNAGQGINATVSGWISKINAFFDAFRPVISKFASDVFLFIGNAVESVGNAFGTLWEVVSMVLSAITGETGKDTQSQMKAWEFLFMSISNGVSIMATAISYLIRGLIGAAKMGFSILQTAADTVVGGVVMVAAAAMAPVQDMINGVIKGINLLRSAMGKTGYDLVHFADDLGKAAVVHISDSWKNAGNDIGGAWQEMTDGISKDTSSLVGKLQSNFDQYNQTIDTTSGKNSDLSARIKATLDGMSGSLGKATTAQGNAKQAAKEHADEIKKLKDSAENAIKPVIDKIKETQKETDDARKKIKEQANEWKKYKEEGVKALSDVNAEIAKLKKEASDIVVNINSGKDKSLADRSVEIATELKSANEDILKLKQDITKEDSPDKQKELLSLQQKITDLEKERDYIKTNASQKAIDEAEAYAKLSKAQQIVADAEKEKASQLDENIKKMQAAVEKQMILEAQAHQNSISNLAIQTGIKDGLLTASIELEKGKRVEIHDQENINLANDIAQKQLTFKTELDTLSSQLQLKLQAQKENISQTQALYKEFNQFLKDDTKKTADDVVATLAQVNAQLRATISLRTQAGFSAAPAAVSNQASGARALGGPVDSGRTYLVGENGPELFVPSKSGQIIPNGGNSGGYSPTVNISLGGVVVQDKNDVDRLVNRLSDELARRMELYKLGIS